MQLQKTGEGRGIPRVEDGRHSPSPTTPASEFRIAFVTTVALTLRSFLLPFAAHFRRRGWVVDAISSDATNCRLCRDGFDRTFDVTWTRSPRDLLKLVGAMRALRSLVRERRYRLVHVHTPVAAFVTRLALRRMHERPIVIYTAHGFHFQAHERKVSSFLFRELERLAGRWTDHLVVINREDHDAAVRLRMLPRERIHYIPGIGVDLDKYGAQSAMPGAVDALRRSLGLDERDQLVVMIAEFNSGKRHRDALCAVARISDTRFHLAFVGTGPTQEAERRRAASLGIEQRVHFLGYRTDVPVLLRTATLVVLPSEREGLPRSILEAMAAGTPVVATDIRGVRDLLGDGAGVLVPVGDVPRLAEALERTLADQQLRNRISRTARKRVEDYSLDKVLEHHERLYGFAARQDHSSHAV